VRISDRTGDPACNQATRSQSLSALTKQPSNQDHRSVCPGRVVIEPVGHHPVAVAFDRDPQVFSTAGDDDIE
jgi:hypothetical protein